MKVLFAASEVYPLIKTGGLADVACFLPIALHEQGCDIRIVMPAYRSILAQGTVLKSRSGFFIPQFKLHVRLLETTLPGGQVPVYLVDIPELFDRPGGPYQAPAGTDWPDNARRFAIFGYIIHLISLNQVGLHWSPELLHCNDWHTGIATALLANQPQRPATVFTIHNLAYQGRFPYETYQSLMLPPHLWSMDALEFHGELSFIKGGLVFADRLTTVSPTYAREITTPEYGYGMEGLLQLRADKLTGILNGVDYRIWDPRLDPVIAHHYGLTNLADKKINKLALQRELGLKVNEDAILLAHISRLIGQKGIDLILNGVHQLLQDKDVQLVILGTGEDRYEQELRAAAVSYDQRLVVVLDYNEILSHRIQAGSDIFLMPSRFEPCGLTQLYAMRYGTIPVVRCTGGLADTVVDANKKSLQTRHATGFHFHRDSLPEFMLAAGRAIHMYRSAQPTWRQIMATAMSQDFSWEKSAQQYRQVYEDARHSLSIQKMHD